MEGHCSCKGVRYQIASAPMIVHCCHCRWCQRESGAAFAINALLEADRVTLLAGTPLVVETPSESGKGQRIARCPTCFVGLWSNYSGAGDKVRFVRAGTLVAPDLVPPEIHIFTATKQPWVQLPEGAKAFPVYYDSSKEWPAASLERRRAIFG